MAPLRPVRLGTRHAVRTELAAGASLVRSAEALRPYPTCLTDRLANWAQVAPERVFLARRRPDGPWRTVTYAETLALVRRLGQALLDRGLSAERPLVILSGNDIEHALLALAALHVGVPHAPISPPYSLVSTDFGKLRHVIGLLSPGLVFAADGARFARAIEAAVPRDVPIAVTSTPPPGRPAVLFEALCATPAGSSADAAHDRVTPDDIAKILFTSGSTGLPKGVINTQRMIASNQQMIAQVLAVLADEPPVLVDWLPWHHTFGGNHNVGIALYNGGTLYIDDGKPMPGAIGETVRNLREIAPTVYFNVPKGYEELLPFLRAEPALRRHFFSRLKLMFYAGAGLSQHVWDELQSIAAETCGERITMVTGLGATETAPMAINATWLAERPGMIGIPVPGVDIKLVPNGRKLEVRVRGPNVTPGYWRQPELTRAAFDDDGFYRMGDAVRFVDPQDIDKGFVFDGRIGEDFKLATGTWVSVGPLRVAAISALAPLARDVVVTGHDRDDVGLLIVPDASACAALAGLPADAALADVAASAALQREIARRLKRFEAGATGSANRVVRAMLLAEPPSLDANEITDKGSLNQRAIIERRAALVDELYAAAPSPRVILPDAGA